MESEHGPVVIRGVFLFSKIKVSNWAAYSSDGRDVLKPTGNVKCFLEKDNHKTG